ncbi:ABC transporter ATP-binding protein [Desulfitobacterium metallireducens]|uniref:Sugar ABC transporter ATPase n=1 Tax=Desulfitobacterium metallireducens DSM 15288 TaxID=871968 RepID=W0EEW6_9FIRM|nr:ABC transporter ATP-binding protein [Desulfitobacterium metallireducens]AHF08068.1 sugar ABC transporter ATPase [Desulfitobacterium metallireducens DSM 15288]
MGLLIDHVSKNFHSKHKTIHVLDRITLEIQTGEFVCILGPSGCGKSTLLNIIAGLEIASEGEILLNDKEIKAPGKDRVVMFQESALFPWLKVIDNVEFGMKMIGIPKEERRKRALAYLEMVHLIKFKDSYIHELSGGMKQRIALARALALDSDILLMDEPFAALDSQTKTNLQLELQKIWLETRKTIIFVTHNVEEAVILADRVVVLASNPGRIKTVFEIEVERPRQIEHEISTVDRIKKELNWEEDEIAGDLYKIDGAVQKNPVLRDFDSFMGISLSTRR